MAYLTFALTVTLCPGGTSENSPAFQPLGLEFGHSGGLDQSERAFFCQAAAAPTIVW